MFLGYLTDVTLRDPQGDRGTALLHQALKNQDEKISPARRVPEIAYG